MTDPAPTNTKQACAPWTELYFARDLMVIGRIIHHSGGGFSETDHVIARVEPHIPEAHQVAKDIAAALNMKFT